MTIDLTSGIQILLYKLKQGQCRVHLSSTIQIGAFNTGRFHSLVVSPVGAIQNKMLDSQANPTNRVNHRGMRKTGEENKLEQPRHTCVYKNRPTHGMIGGLLSPSSAWALPFLAFPLSS